VDVALLDSNALIALAVVGHVHHDAARRWLGPRRQFATCPVTQGALVRLVIQKGGSASEALRSLEGVVSHRRHEFWPDEVSYTSVPLGGVIGHRQVTDAYLATLVRYHSGRLATFDEGLAALHSDVAELIGTG
jgi:toxin-antitoxin system PIN domain toxin